MDGVTEMYGDEHYEGRPIRVSYRWSDVRPATARWEQAFSTDGGESWEPNWIMNLTRAEADPDGR